MFALLQGLVKVVPEPKSILVGLPELMMLIAQDMDFVALTDVQIPVILKKKQRKRDFSMAMLFPLSTMRMVKFCEIILSLYSCGSIICQIMS